MIEVKNMECWTCRSISGEKRISPGPTIYEGKYWLVEHAFPIKVKGWLVIVLKRHAEALHELSSKEWFELSAIQWRVVNLLHSELNCEKEYLSCYAEGGHFNHIHIHILAKPINLENEYKGTRSFGLIDVTESESIPKEDIIELCKILRERMTKSIES